MKELVIVSHYGFRVHALPAPSHDRHDTSWYTMLRDLHWSRLGHRDTNESVVCRDWPNIQMHAPISGGPEMACIQWHFTAEGMEPWIEKEFFPLRLNAADPAWEGDPELFMVAFLGPLSAWQPEEERERFRRKLKIENDTWIAHLFRSEGQSGPVIPVVLLFRQELGGLLTPVPYLPPPKT